MTPRVLIVGQGLAGTALGLELEAAGIPFEIVSGGHGDAASGVAAGLVNPVTGRRWVKSAHVDRLLPQAREAYGRWESVLGVRLWHPLRLTRRWRDAEERAAVEAKIARGELAPHVAAVTEQGVELAGAAWVDLPALLAAAARRWRAQGCWREARVKAEDLREAGGGWEWGGARFGTVVLCAGFGTIVREAFGAEPFALAKGEMLGVRGCPLGPDVGWSGGIWVLGGPGGSARVGATYERDREDLSPTAAAREHLAAAAEHLVGAPLEVVAQTAGVRLTLPDRLPLCGWHPGRPGLGVCGALGSKGSLWAPALARAWAEALRGGAWAVGFAAETAPGRFAADASR